MRYVVSQPAFSDGRGLLATLRDNFAANLKRLLQERNLTQRAFAKAIGVDEAVVSRWLKRRHFPEDRYIDKAAAVLDVSFEEFVQEPGKPREQDAVLRFLRDAARSRGHDLIKKS